MWNVKYHNPRLTPKYSRDKGQEDCPKVGSLPYELGEKAAGIEKGTLSQ